MLAVFVIVGCTAKYLNKRLEKKLQQYIQVNNHATQGDLFPFFSAKQKHETLNIIDKQEEAVGN